MAIEDYKKSRDSLTFREEETEDEESETEDNESDLSEEFKWTLGWLQVLSYWLDFLFV